MIVFQILALALLALAWMCAVALGYWLLRATRRTLGICWRFMYRIAPVWALPLLWIILWRLNEAG